MNNINLKINFGIDYELTRVKNTLRKLDWYNSQNYKPRLPEGINQESSEEEAKNKILDNYDEKKYQEAADNITAYFLSIDEKLFENLEKISAEKIPGVFFINLTSYGTNGSYGFPDTVIFNLNSKNGYKVIVHEVVHLAIDPWINKYKIKHWEKECIVDLILNSKEFDFLEYGHRQPDYRGADKYLDDLFKTNFFKNPEEFFKQVADYPKRIE